jgi:aspartate/methionine/tyrosine aminotransferase
MVLPEQLVRPVERLAQNMMISAPHISQIAAEAALDCHAELQANVARYRRARDRLIAAMPARWFAQPPQGAFYLYADLGAGADSTAFCRDQLDHHGIACAPGVDFDAARGHRYARFSYAGDEAMLAEAARRLAAQYSQY